MTKQLIVESKVTQNITQNRVSVLILWAEAPKEGSIEVINGDLSALRVSNGKGEANGGDFFFDKGGLAALELAVGNTRIGLGAYPTLITIHTNQSTFTFFLRDVNEKYPIYILEYGVAITKAGDRRDFHEIVEAIQLRNLLSGVKEIESQPEESYEAACEHNRQQMCPTWLGLSRDMRIFRVSHSPEMGYWGVIEPVYHSVSQSIPETGNKPYKLDFCIGPGSSCRMSISRRLEEGVLPILHAQQREDDIIYHLTAFATLETQPLSPGCVRGTDWQAAYANTGGNMLSQTDKERIRHLLKAEMYQREEEVVCCVTVKVENTGNVPRYAWFKGLRPNIPAEIRYDEKKGFAKFSSDWVYGIQRIQGLPMPQEEMAVLIQPGEFVVVEMLVPHQPVSLERAEALSKLDIESHHAACRAFWLDKLNSVAELHIPEASVDERLRAGLLHCDIAALGQEPDGDVLATIGWYAPIGSESSPIIQFFDSMGWHQLAERSLNFFLSRQRADGFIQNFGGYQLETGPALWTMGEHYRYTRDDEWVRRIKPGLLKACEYLLNWRVKNQHETMRGRGYGLLDGKVADPDDFFHSFMLNGLSYIGIQRVSEMLRAVDPQESNRLAKEAEDFREDIRTAYYEALARSPVIPLGSGEWVPSVPPWAEYRGSLALYAEGGNWFTHGTFHGRDSLIGPLYLVISEVLSPEEIGTSFMLKSHQVLSTVENAGLSQPYYVRHDIVHLLRGEVKAFLKTYYNQFTALQDRETYTFWEHYFHASQHKTHEEGWFLMQTRWMLWLERGNCLKLLSGIPRRWLADGKCIELVNVASYFGPVSLHVESNLTQGLIKAEVICETDRRPKTVELRMPHPLGKKAVHVSGGDYDPEKETVFIDPFDGRTTVTLEFIDE